MIKIFPYLHVMLKWSHFMLSWATNLLIRIRLRNRFVKSVLSKSGMPHRLDLRSILVLESIWPVSGMPAYLWSFLIASLSWSSERKLAVSRVNFYIVGNKYFWGTFSTKILRVQLTDENSFLLSEELKSK